MVTAYVMVKANTGEADRLRSAIEDIEGVNEEFHVSEEVSLLTITLFVVGFGIGACCSIFRPWRACDRR